MQITGVGVGHGIAVGPALRMPDPIGEPPDVDSQAEASDEYRRVETTLHAVTDELVALGHQAGGDAEEILEAQSLMAQDPAVVDDISRRIGDGKTAERAVFEAYEQYAKVLDALGEVPAARGADVRDVARRVIAKLRGVALPTVPQSDAPYVLVANDLAPADTATLDLRQVIAVVTRDGSTSSHTAILARNKNLVAVVGATGCDAIINGQTVIVDAEHGEVVVDPERSAVSAAAERGGTVSTPRPLTPGRLADGTAIPLLANVGSPEEAAPAVALGAEGVGLFRTEFLYLDARTAPSVELQRSRYRDLMAAFSGRKVVVRVLDAGADKQLAFLGHTHEENPALGRRGLRALREHEDVLRDQLTALAEAQNDTGADLWVMAPMVADVDETAYFIGVARSLGLSTVGITVEVPSAAVLADQIVPLCDFVSIGTNDLTQYTLAADRQLGSVAHYQDPWHPAVLRLIKLIGDAARVSNTPVGVCGESASDPLMAVTLVGLGADDLSMSPGALADVRATLAGVTLEQARELATLALVQHSAADARAAVANALA
ncbi:phosphoenolpyruvate--protein phosphotransferase [Humibacter ginsenosidimutans]|uniref:Phosphoenolpyruvate-protein phosphotransferase n=2 Tax=Humibacter ginsenosidimutans TaxID=2599293 RepID=A0A5B8M959_9MICO|nr:phosphoenolpyruvate--protein phosphotransferase [Humibacter ginsenosidimutans]